MAEIRQSLEIDVPIDAAYDQWSRFESFPIFMDNVDRVEQLSEDEVFFETHLQGEDRSWVARIVKQEPGREIRWESIEGARNNGRVLFERLGRERTRVIFEMDYEPTDWRSRFGNITGLVDRRVKEDLTRFKRFIERKEQTSLE